LIIKIEKLKRINEKSKKALVVEGIVSDCPTVFAVVTFAPPTVQYAEVDYSVYSHFCPLVPLASRGLLGLLSQISTP